ncbi:uncharacterized protein LOC130139302 isoform X2 [Syzygium oleosum]|uniref:uncharacterized protein LOC130139302 isoform X2 n=2 Tax=Syzygium oleosum TaxID=219896 RepID=UPI0024B88195|nr:uncharacterized protein LOC130139302 isoform X2 [Syzygium oleosum]
MNQISQRMVETSSKPEQALPRLPLSICREETDVPASLHVFRSMGSSDQSRASLWFASSSDSIGVYTTHHSYEAPNWTRLGSLAFTKGFYSESSKGWICEFGSL